MRRSGVLPLAGVLLLVTAACTGPAAGSSSSPVALRSTVPPGLTDSGPIQPPPWDDALSPGTLSTVLIQGVDGWDNVHFVFTGAPTCSAQRVVTPEGHGDRLPPAMLAQAFVEVRCVPVDVPAGLPSRWVGDTAVVSEVVDSGRDGNAYVWVVGLRRPAPFGLAWMSGGEVRGVVLVVPH